METTEKIKVIKDMPSLTVAYGKSTFKLSIPVILKRKKQDVINMLVSNVERVQPDVSGHVEYLTEVVNEIFNKYTL